MDKKEFDEFIKNNEGYDLFLHSYENLTEEQRDKSFNNACENDLAFKLLRICFKKLTEEQQIDKYVIKMLSWKPIKKTKTYKKQLT